MSNRLLKRLVIAVLIALTGGEGYNAYINGVPVGEEINGVVTNVIDGDTLRVNGIKMRLWGVDAPEKDQTGYPQATSTLNDAVFLKKVSCVIRDRDHYNRLVTQCFRDKADIGAIVIESGWARDYRRHSKGYYLKEELSARKAKKGLWNKKPFSVDFS